MDKQLNNLLLKGPIKNMAILGFFSQYPIESFHIEGNSAIIFGRSDQLWAHISSSNAEELKILLGKYQHKTKSFYSVEEWMIPYILEYGEPYYIMKTNRYILDLTTPTDQPKMEIVEIDRTHKHYMYENSDYKKYISTKYIEERLEKDISAGILVENTLVAWGFTHDDGALGFLHVMPEYRKTGYGLDISLALIQMRKEAQKPIFVNIVPENTPSINLVTKLGFKFDRETNWIKLK